MDEFPRDILVGYDGSSDANSALQWAAQTAVLDDRPVTVAIIDDFDASRAAITWPKDYWIELEQQAVAVLATAAVSDGKVHRVRGHPMVTTPVSRLLPGHGLPVSPSNGAVFVRTLPYSRTVRIPSVRSGLQQL